MKNDTVKVRLSKTCTLFLFLVYAIPVEAQWWKVQTSGIDTNLRAVSAVYASDAKTNGAPLPVVWTSGSNGVILKSIDEGKTWTRLHVTGGDVLDFRGIVAFDASTAYVMSSGEGEKSRIYKTIDGGQTWNLQFMGSRKEVFLDSIVCSSEKQCLALGDPIDGKFLLLKTADGEHWNPLSTDSMPAAVPGEAAFAASNSCITFSDAGQIFFGTGGTAARVFQSSDSGLTWMVARTPIVQGSPSSGIFALRIDKRDHVLVLGGDYKEPADSDRVAATSLDNGKTWQLAVRQPGGFRSALAHIDDGRWVAVGPTGEDVTEDYGAHWKHTDSLNLNAVELLDTQTGWAVGAHGTVARFINHFVYIRYRPRNDHHRPTSAIAD
jgi:photosystem II stability/assembly factor-like uncharacterized protein